MGPMSACQKSPRRPGRRGAARGTMSPVGQGHAWTGCLMSALTPIGPGSTVASAAAVNEIKVQTAALLLEGGALPPVITSSAVVGSERADAVFEAAYREHARRMAGGLAAQNPRSRIAADASVITARVGRSGGRDDPVAEVARRLVLEDQLLAAVGQ